MRRPRALRRLPPSAALLVLLVALPASSGIAIGVGETFSLVFGIPDNTSPCTYEIVDVSVSPPIATPLAFPETVFGDFPDTFSLDFTATAEGSAIATATLNTSTGCNFDFTAAVNARVEIGGSKTPMQVLVIDPKDATLEAFETRTFIALRGSADEAGNPDFGPDGIPGNADDDFEVVSVAWSVTGRAGRVSPSSGRTTTFKAGAGGQGEVVAMLDGMEARAPVFVNLLVLPKQPMSEQEAARGLRKDAKRELKEAKGDFHAVLEEFCTALDAVESDLRANPDRTAGDAMQDVIDALNGLFGGVSDVARDAAGDINVRALFYYFQTTGIPFSGSLAGDCDTIDKARARLASDMEKVIGQALRKFKAFSMRIAKNEQGVLTGRIEVPAPPEIAPNPEEPAPAPFKKYLKIGSAIAVSEPGQGPDARQVCVSGSADPADGATVSVQVLMPGASPEVVVAQGEAPVDPETCRWLICVRAEGADPILPGNYTVRARQASGLVSEITLGVPAPPAP